MRQNGCLATYCDDDALLTKNDVVISRTRIVRLYLMRIMKLLHRISCRQILAHPELTKKTKYPDRKKQ